MAISGYSDNYVDSITPMNLGWSPYFDGRYYQPIDQDTVQRRREEVESASLDGVIGELTLRQFQDFVELNWLRPHGEFRTVLKMEQHFIDEHREFVDANESLWRKRLDKLLDEDSASVISELGDMAWFFGAFATNGAIDYQSAWRHRLKRDRVGNPNDNVKLKKIDDLISSGYFPRMGIFDPDEDVAVDLLFAAGFVTVGTKILLEENSDKNNYSVPNRQHDIGLWLTNAVGLITLHAQSVGGSLTEVVEENIRKISARVDSNTVDNKSARIGNEI